MAHQGESNEGQDFLILNYLLPANSLIKYVIVVVTMIEAHQNALGDNIIASELMTPIDLIDIDRSVEILQPKGAFLKSSLHTVFTCKLIQLYLILPYDCLFAYKL